MCLGEVVQVVEVRTANEALARTGGREVRVSLLTLDDPVAAGDWIVMHSGFALARLSAEEAHEAIALRRGHRFHDVPQESCTPLEGSV